MGHRRVLVLAEYGWRNGGENSWIAVAKLLVDRGWEFVVACPQQTELSNFLAAENIPTLEWEFNDERGVRKSQSLIRCELAGLIRETNPALVHGNSLSTARLTGPVTADLGVPALGYLRDIISLSKQAIDDLNRLDCLIAVSEATKTYHVGQGICPEKTFVIYNGVNLDQFFPRPATGFLHDELQIPKVQRLIACIGQIGMRKGTDIVIQSFLKLAELFPDLDLLLVGIRNSVKDEAMYFETDCRQLPKSPGQQNRVHWLGRRTDVSRILSESTLLLHGARQEPLGRVLLEAAACGCPFVATDVGGSKEIVRGHGCDFLIVNADSVSELTSAAQLLLHDETLRCSTGAKLRQIAETRFDASICAEKLHHTYTRLVSGNRPST